MVALAITAPISRLKACSLSYFHVTKRAAAKRTNEKTPMLGLAQVVLAAAAGVPAALAFAWKMCLTSKPPYIFIGRRELFNRAML